MWYSKGERRSTVSEKRSNRLTQISILISHPDCGEPLLRMKKGGWLRIKDWVPTKFSVKELFCPGKPSFLKENSFWTGWIFSYPNYSLSGDSGRDSFQQSESSFDWEIFYRAARCLEKQRKLPRLNKTYITSVMHPKANKTQRNEIVLNFIHRESTCQQ